MSCSGCTGCSGCGWGGCSGCSWCSSCSTKHCRGNEDANGALCYPKCRSGYHNVGCCICSPVCPSVVAYHGAMCWKKRYGRGVGRMTTCSHDAVYDAGLCYKQCYLYCKGIGPVSWWSPKTQWATYSNTRGEFQWTQHHFLKYTFFSPTTFSSTSSSKLHHRELFLLFLPQLYCYSIEIPFYEYI